MLIVNRIPWIALTLLLLSYSTLGWVFSEAQAPWFVWLAVVLTLLLLVGILTAPYATIANYFGIFFGSNTKTFIATVLGAFLFFMMIAWFRVFLDTLLIISAAILARIDFQSAGFKEGQAFIITSIFSILGVGLGALINMMVRQQLLLW
ncbi:hypothetical protein Nos7524_5354 [Nostoc sp. PCC 7524]|uniref:hypothetical protein n=1 Tax=Nostoc sp. (strain ATCC 29411 / PCC 7524) TaxID=28072 RepID=UPI00029EE7E3|nr:hypothetical protein [Nostoc sp. PCC 7524]AFY51073.1 hypothetical protein Nos7524_5354 [Nostoc sp. PCC 7524]